MAALIDVSARRWRTEWLEEGIARGRADERALLRRQAARRFGAETGERLAGLLAGMDAPAELEEVGDWIVDSATGTELLERLRDGRTPRGGE